MKKADQLLLITLMAAAMVVGPVRSDMEADEGQCKDQLMSLTPCLSYVSGDGKSPPSAQCCSVVTGKLNSTLKCMCILVKDRDDPGLGVKINPNLALSLPNMCHSPSNASKCIELLGLSPASKEAQVFVQFDNSTHASGATAAQDPADPAASSNATQHRKWYIINIAALIWCILFTSTLFN